MDRRAAVAALGAAAFGSALKGSVVPSPGFGLGTQGGGSQQAHRVASPHQNSSRFRYSQLALIDANASAG